MLYIEFKNRIRSFLMENSSGATWKELKEALDLPYKTPCPTWIKKLEADIGLLRERGQSKALNWRIKG